ncbi:hypothetical protein C8R43DRAFT_942386 [Mycena crocata]|nr:hypothetical protein C8R43DRAFT_942386 [Mycena crocata]
MARLTIANSDCQCIEHSNTASCNAPQCYATNRTGSRLNERLRRIPSKELFKCCLRSTENFYIITRYLQEQPDIEELSGSPTGSLEKIPTDVIEILALYLPIRDRIQFGSTSRYYRTTTQKTLLAIVARSLHPYYFSLVHLRFLQSCTPTIVGGATIKKWLCYQPEDKRPPRLWGLSRRVHSQKKPQSLDLYCSKHIDMVIDFVTRATGYTAGNYIGDMEAIGGIRIAVTLTRTDAPNINIFSTLSPNPFDAILYLPTTADMWAMMLDRFWHAYPHMTFKKLAITTPTRLPLKGLSDRQRAWDAIQSNYDVGIQLDCDLHEYHTCSGKHSCPLAPRTNRDSGCLVLKLPNLPVSALGTEAIWKDESTVGWTLGTTTFCQTWWNGEEDNVRSYRNTEVIISTRYFNASFQYYLLKRALSIGNSPATESTA